MFFIKRVAAYLLQRRINSSISDDIKKLKKGGFSGPEAAMLLMANEIKDRDLQRIVYDKVQEISKIDKEIKKLEHQKMKIAQAVLPYEVFVEFYGCYPD
jgi:hypothetical protein